MQSQATFSFHNSHRSLYCAVHTRPSFLLLLGLLPRVLFGSPPAIHIILCSLPCSSGGRRRCLTPLSCPSQNNIVNESYHTIHKYISFHHPVMSLWSVFMWERGRRGEGRGCCAKKRGKCGRGQPRDSPTHIYAYLPDL